ncbi:5-oxoprolinase subunit PxpA [Shimia thalassica]|uniref:LamB/YcsF family protein n=1 Tax=Shimia thalassica TaxID=1715693 RepID=UPI0026E37F26|nr:5-oxoprolinase subunit PxpA [Shimia thalassica]MDO6523190.1 5-oxoprolinase subunit PxpA [Shimia thalassica]MDP2495938.1 5-oxoprolinase subunit PxpA [Shimia thalassica]MDP2517890.1 5-oxoprolinase subunit PxpA [Shimia thalassica]
MQIDLNSDLGESFGPWTMGDDATMLSLVNSANIACGGHASDPETMYKTLSLAKQHGVMVGAHPGYNDREGFGRRVIPMAPDEIGRMVAAQIGALVSVAALVPVKVRYVKPHGALGNLAARDPDVARAIAATILKIDPTLAVLAISGTCLEHAARDAGLTVFSEIFADRGYLSTGQLVPRGTPGAMIHDAEEAAARLLAFLKSGKMPVIDGDPIPLAAHSICVHGDGPAAVAMAREIRQRLEADGVTVSAFLNP